MHQIHGFVEFPQLDEWYGVVDLGSLLVPNLELSKVILEAARKNGSLQAPDDQMSRSQRSCSVIARPPH